MPVVVTFDVDTESTNSNDRNRVLLAFQRFGWEHIGGSAYRYPKLAAGAHPSEDWFNHVIPALMFFRAVVEKHGVVVSRFTIEAHSSPGSGDAGADIAKADAIQMYEPTRTDDGKPLSDETKKLLSESRLRKWVKAVSDEAPGNA